MRIIEILFWDNVPTKRTRSDPQLDLPLPRFNDDPTNLANAFTRSGLVKHLWNLPGSESQPFGPAPPGPGGDLIASGTSQPTASLQPGPVETEPSVKQYRLIPFR